MVGREPTDAGWSSLPEHLVTTIVQLAFADTDRTPPQWGRWGLICRHVHCSLHACRGALHTSALSHLRRKPSLSTVINRPSGCQPARVTPHLACYAEHHR